MAGLPIIDQEQMRYPFSLLENYFNCGLCCGFMLKKQWTKRPELNTFHTNKFHIIDSINIVKWAGPFFIMGSDLKLP